MNYNFDDVTKKIILNKLRLRCNICYSHFSDDAYVSVIDKFFTHKTFFIYNKKIKKSGLYPNHALVVSERSMIGNNSNSIFNAVKIKSAPLSAVGYGRVIQVDLCCSKCNNSVYYEINLEKLSGQNHWT